MPVKGLITTEFTRLFGLENYEKTAPLYWKYTRWPWVLQAETNVVLWLNIACSLTKYFGQSDLVCKIKIHVHSKY